jgi:hypothetical protein
MDKRQEGESIGDWLKRVSIKDSGWLDKARWRQKNEYWLKYSFKIAVKILIAIREQGISKEQLEQRCGFELGRTLNGDKDFTLSEICKIQDVLQISLISLINNESTS